MTLKYIADNSAYFTDELFNEVQIMSFANKAIDRINVECKTYFPQFTDMNSEYKAIPKKFLFSLVSPYISYGIKMNDTSLTEAQMYLEDFYRVLKTFSEEIGSLVNAYTSGDEENGISSEYIANNGFGGVYGIDTSGAIEKGFFGYYGNGGSF